MAGATGSVSLKQNFAYKALLSIANPLMALLTFPYVSRVLGVENIGLINFVDNTINYFMLFATMGITNIGIRAIAAVKGSREEMNRAFSNILGLNLIFTLIVLLVYNVLIACIPQFNVYSELFYIGSAKILFTSLMVEWFFTGIENFRYITLRTIFIRLLFVVSVFLFVKEENDYKLYFTLMTLVVVVNASINILYSKKYVSIKLRELFTCRYLKENLRLGVYSILTSMYLTFNVMYLGLVANNVEVGYYTSAFKFYVLVLNVFTAFTSVIFPRMSSLISTGDQQKFESLIEKSFGFVSMLALPLTVCGSVLAPELIRLLCGAGYEGAILPMRILMPSLVFVGLAQIMAIQILLPLKKDDVLLYTSVAGAVVSIVINILVVPHLHSIGSAIVMLVSEFVVTAIYIIYVRKKKLVKLRWSVFGSCVLKTVPCALVCVLFQILFDHPVVVILASFVVSVLIYAALNLSEIKQYFL